MNEARQPVGVVLINLGGPENLEEIRPFLRRLLSDPLVMPIPWPLRPWLARRIARRRAPVVTEHYRAIGGRSPIGHQSRGQAEALGRKLGSGFVAKYAFRHSAPFAWQVAREFASAGVQRVIALPAFPQWSHTTSGSAVLAFLKPAARQGIQALEAPSYPDRPGYIQALAELTLPLIDDRTHVLITAHGLPERLVKKGDPYVNQVKRTASALAARLPAGTKHSLAFQSRLGRATWTGPYLADEIERLGNQGVRDLLVVPVSFVCENLETLYELDVQMAELAKRCGIDVFRRVPTPGCHASFIEELASLVVATASKVGWKDWS